MKAIVIHEYGGPEVLKYEDVPDPAPGPGELLVRVAASSVNPFDLKLPLGPQFVLRMPARRMLPRKRVLPERSCWLETADKRNEPNDKTCELAR
jgi:hypothetical protein